MPELTSEIKSDTSAPAKEMLRRRRYERAPKATDFVALTPTKAKLLRFLAEYRFLSLPQLARLCCPNPRLDLSCKSARRQMRELFDAGLVDVLPVSRLALAEPDVPNDQTLLYGSAPNIYVPTPRGLTFLHQAGMIDKGVLKRPQTSYGPKNSLFLAHELQVRDVRVWLETTARHSGGQQWVLAWRDGIDAILEIENSCAARPDAWFVYQVGENGGKEIVLVGLVEVDRGTERGNQHWQEKITDYSILFSSKTLEAEIGYVNARVLIIAPNSRRRDQLAEFIAKQARAIADRFWLAEHSVINVPDMTLPLWRQPINEELSSLLPHQFSVDKYSNEKLLLQDNLSQETTQWEHSSSRSSPD